VVLNVPRVWGTDESRWRVPDQDHLGTGSQWQSIHACAPGGRQQPSWRPLVNAAVVAAAEGRGGLVELLVLSPPGHPVQPGCTPATKGKL
jgi:hypothetical protein